MIAIWISAILLALVLLTTAFLIFKRIRLIHKLKKQSDKVQFLRNRFRSIFIFDGKPDLIVKKGDRSYSVSIITTPFQRVRYHFYNPERMDIYLVNKGYFLSHFKLGRMASMERTFKIKKYKIKFDFQSDLPHYIIWKYEDLRFEVLFGKRHFKYKRGCLTASSFHQKRGISNEKHGKYRVFCIFLTE